MSSKRFWKRRRQTRRNDLPKMVFESPAEDIYEKGFLGIGPRGWRDSGEICSAIAETLQEHVPGDIREFSVGRNGNTADGYCIADPFGRKCCRQPLTKAYAYVDCNDGIDVEKIRVVYPGRLGSGYLKGLSDMFGSSWKRIV